MKFTSIISSLTLLALIAAEQTAEQLCSSSDAQQSCGHCIKAHEECAWCIDPHSYLANRCQAKSKFSNETCTPHLIYSPQTAQVKIQQNLPLETKQHDGKTLVRLQPQAISVRLMPGHTATVDFKYLHQTDPNGRSPNPETMEIQTSDVRDSRLTLKFFIKCDGEFKETKSCRVQDKQIVEFKIEIIVNSCSDSGDITLSVGILGQRTIAGLYVTTICGCECEKHPEINSRLCHQNGHLVCGQCICDQSRGGDKCECPLSSYGVTSASELENKCKFNSTSDVCSSSGKCKCGQCECNKPTVTGKFCQCDNDSCPLAVNGKVCSGNGVCDCGVCKCELGWERADCSCDTASNNCVENGEPTPKTEKTEPESPKSEPESVTSAPTTDMPSDEDLEEALDKISENNDKLSSSSFSIQILISIMSLLLVF